MKLSKIELEVLYSKEKPKRVKEYQKPRYRRSYHMTKELISKIKKDLPYFTHREIGKKYGVSTASVQRVKQGYHDK